MLAVAVAAVVNVVEHGVDGAKAPPALPPTLAATTEAEPGPAVTEPPEADLAAVELPEGVRRSGGTLWWATGGCAVGTADLATGELRTRPDAHCRLWASPADGFAAAVTSRRSEALEGHGLIVLRPRPDGRETRLGHTPGYIEGDVAWSPDGLQLAVCSATRTRVVVDLIPPMKGPSHLRGRCFPAWLPDGRLVTAEPSTLRVLAGDGVLAGPELARALLPATRAGAVRAFSALAAARGLVAVALVTARPHELLPDAAAIAVLGEDGRVVYRARLRPGVFPTGLGLAPDGSAVWYYDAGAGSAVLVSMPGGRRLPYFDVRRFAWSPDGRWLAVAGRSAIEVFSWPDGSLAATIPVAAADLAWAGPQSSASR